MPLPPTRQPPTRQRWTPRRWTPRPPMQRGRMRRSSPRSTRQSTPRWLTRQGAERPRRECGSLVFGFKALPRTLAAAGRDLYDAKAPVRKSAIVDLVRLAWGEERELAIGHLADALG